MVCKNRRRHIHGRKESFRGVVVVAGALYVSGKPRSTPFVDVLVLVSVARSSFSTSFGCALLRF